LYVIWTTSSFNCRHPQCVCTHPIDPMGIHLLCCAHGKECTGTHDVIYGTFAAIVRDASFHMEQE